MCEHVRVHVCAWVNVGERVCACVRACMRVCVCVTETGDNMHLEVSLSHDMLCLSYLWTASDEVRLSKLGLEITQ